MIPRRMFANLNLSWIPCASHRNFLLPVVVVRPAIIGTIQTGLTVSCTTGSWTNGPTGFFYQWYRGGVPVTGATSASYVLTGMDEGQTIYCRVTGTNSYGLSGHANSNSFIPESGISVGQLDGSDAGQSGVITFFN